MNRPAVIVRRSGALAPAVLPQRTPGTAAPVLQMPQASRVLQSSRVPAQLSLFQRPGPARPERRPPEQPGLRTALTS